jgi:hypothetical protein
MPTVFVPFNSSSGITTTDLNSTLSIEKGGTGKTTAADAINALLPAQSRSVGKFLHTNGKEVSWQTPGSFGTVTSVDVSGGMTGLNFNGGPVTIAGTITMGGVLNVENGGTGQASFAPGYVKSNGTAFNTSPIISGADVLGDISGNANNVTGVIAIENGGTGQSSFDQGYMRVDVTGIISVPGVNVNDLLGTTLPASIVNSSLTSLGQLDNLTIAGTTEFGSAYTEKANNISSSSTTDFDCNLGNMFNVTMTSNITTLTFSNIPTSGRVYSVTLFLTQDATGSRTVTWPSSVKWSEGTSPTLTTAANKTDVITLVTFTGGTTWFGFVSGVNF